MQAAHARGDPRGRLAPGDRGDRPLKMFQWVGNPQFLHLRVRPREKEKYMSSSDRVPLKPTGGRKKKHLNKWKQWFNISTLHCYSGHTGVSSFRGLPEVMCRGLVLGGGGTGNVLFSATHISPTISGTPIFEKSQKDNLNPKRVECASK